jgi:hypothetical protein
VASGTLDQVVFFLRAVELSDGRWRCKRGREELGIYPTLEEALTALEKVGSGLDGEFEVRVHSVSAAWPG